MRIRLRLVLILLVALTSQGFALSFEETLTEAEAGNPVAQFNLALAYQSGNSVDKDLALAEAWYEKSAALGHPPAQINLAWLRAEQGDQAAAMQLYLQAAEQGELIAQLEVADRYRDGIGTAADLTLAADWYQRAADQGHAGAMFALANLYATGAGVPRDYARAAELFRGAAERGEVQAHCNLGRLYAEGGPGLERNDARALECFRAGAFQGEPVSQYNLAQYYLHGLGVLPDKIKAYSWYKLAAKQNHPEAGAALDRLQGTLSATEQSMGDVEARQLAEQINP